MASCTARLLATVCAFTRSLTPASSLLFDDSGALWAGGGKGLLCYNPQQDAFEPAGTAFVHAGVNNLVLLPGRQLAVVTDVDLLLLQLPELSLRGYWSDKNGYQLLEACKNGASFDGQFLWIPSGNGIQRLRIDWAEKARTGMALRLDRVEGQPVSLLNSNKQGISIRGSNLTLDLSLLNCEYEYMVPEYRLNGGAWLPGSLISLRIPNLQEGNNAIDLRVRIPGIPEQEWPGTALTVGASLPWQQQPWVPVFVVVVVGAALGLGLRYWRSRQHEKQLSSQLLQVQLATVQAQLNPHVLFNLLASLQNSIANRSKEVSQRHLVQLSMLIREILELSMTTDDGDSSKIPAISLSREIQFLNNYLQLEASQFSPPFQFEVVTALQSDPDALSIPPLLAQPLAENAVQHGLRPSKNPDLRLRIVITETEDHLYIRVEDNGVGLHSKFAHPMHPLRYQSRGSEMLQKRLDLFRQLGLQAECWLEDGVEGGTVATLKIQKLHHAHHSD
ncbi:MAG: histidine kinase [Lewinellaceae bacterium]|nr:histidine kinase [Lewinellaceae bacterium]